MSLQHTTCLLLDCALVLGKEDPGLAVSCTIGGAREGKGGVGGGHWQELLQNLSRAGLKVSSRLDRKAAWRRVVGRLHWQPKGTHLAFVISVTHLWVNGLVEFLSLDSIADDNITDEEWVDGNQGTIPQGFKAPSHQQRSAP